MSDKLLGEVGAALLWAMLFFFSNAGEPHLVAIKVRPLNFSGLTQQLSAVYHTVVLWVLGSPHHAT